MQFEDQLSSKHLIEAMASYLTSNTLRYTNRNYDNSDSQQVSNFTDGSECFATYTSVRFHVGDRAPCNKLVSQGTFGDPVRPLYRRRSLLRRRTAGFSAGMPGRGVHALDLPWQQRRHQRRLSKITGASLSEQWRPNDALYVNFATRYESDTYDLANTNNPATNFWFAAAQQEFCVNPVTRQPIFVPQPPQYISFYQPLVRFNCPIDRSTGKPVQTVHPNGTDGILLTNNYPSSYSVGYGLPRISATYTVNPDTVLRASAGRYAQQPQNYEIQYDTLQPNLASTLLGIYSVRL